ncbi:MAG: DNA circularization N-terminal domain-containing protein [Gammaproteobacteria bacterium]|nr:DNA circularization N-terminal domain-containing protein [Gammaproteobacteria bacterium]
MSSWRDRLVWANEDNQQRKKASFRGVPFFVRDSDRSIGRRNIVHQYPYRDIPPFIEDLGRDSDEFTINGYVIQNTDNNQDYIDERDALIEALRDFGKGTLIHPYYGELEVNLLGKVRIEESFAQGGIARFTMTFVLAERAWRDNMSPSTLSSAGWIVDDDVDTIAEQASSQALDDFSSVGWEYVEEAPTYTVNSIMDAITSLNSMLRSVKGRIQGAFPSQISRALAILAKVRAGIDVSLLTDACGLATEIVGMFNGLKSIVGMYGALLSDQLLGACSGTVYGFFTGPMSGAKVISSTGGTGFAASTMSTPSKINEGLGKTIVKAVLAINRFGENEGGANPSSYGGTIAPVMITTSQRAKQSASLIAIVNLVRINALILASQIAIRIDYDSYNSAIQTMEEVTAELDSLLLKLGDDSADIDYDPYNITISNPNSYSALASLRPVFVKAMEGISDPLAKIINYEVLPETISTLTLAYERYYDLERENEIIVRNLPLVSHPGFLPGGRTIEVLNE